MCSLSPLPHESWPQNLALQQQVTRGDTEGRGPRVAQYFFSFLGKGPREVQSPSNQQA